MKRTKNEAIEYNKEKFAASINSIIDIFESGDIPEAIAHSTIPLPDVPCAKWHGLVNRLIMYINTHYKDKHFDCRTFVQWKEVSRYPKKGSKSFALWRPDIRKAKDKATGEEETYLAGFRAFNVFSYSDTDGEELDYVTEIEPPEPPPLVEVAEEWGVDVSYVPTANFWGAYNPSADDIKLATHDESTFFHELAHAAHKRVLKEKGRDLYPGQHTLQEVVAELTSAVLCRAVGKQEPATGRSYTYIKAYAEKIDMTPVEVCRRVLEEVDKCLQLILANRPVEA